MLTTRVIPCLDTSAGRVVKGIRFAGLRDAGDPAACAARYEEQGADELVLLDVSATPESRSHRLDTLRRVRSVLSIPLTAGGGVRSEADAVRLLETGADKVAVNTAAVECPGLLPRLAARFGSQCVVAAIDATRRGGEGWEVAVESGRRPTGRGAVDWAREAASLGAGEILLTAIDRDGTRDGYDLALIAAVARTVTVPVVASGGARGPSDMVAAVRAGADAVLAASMFHDGDWTVAALKRALAEGGVRVRDDRCVD